MTSDFNLDKYSTCKKANSYMKNKMRYYESSEGSNSDLREYNHLIGQALHTIMDNSSPAHSGFHRRCFFKLYNIPIFKTYSFQLKQTDSWVNRNSTHEHGQVIPFVELDF